MKNRKTIVIVASALLVIVAALINIVRGSEETQTFANAVLLDPDYPDIITKELMIYSEEENEMIPVKISNDDKEKLTELMFTTNVSKDIKKPSSSTPIVEYSFISTPLPGANITYTLHQNNNDYYVAIPTDIYIEQIEWYILKGSEIPEFYFELLAKSDL